MPVIVGIEPPHAPPGHDVTTKGSGLADVRLARFGLQGPPTFRISSDAEIAARVPGGADAVAVTVLNARGAGTVAQAFTID